jgi:adenylyltransferase/sulfurtransferase
MKTDVFIMATMRSFTGHSSHAEVVGETVEEALHDLINQYPELAKVLFNPEGELNEFINIFVGDEDIRQRQNLATKLEDEKELIILPVIAGGSGAADEIISTERRKEVKLDNEEIERYGNHLLLRQIGVKGQKKIKAGKVLVAGAGSLGSPLLLYLAAAGVGTLGIADFDEVSVGNLQNQIIHGKRDLNRPKTASAKDSIRLINPTVKVEVYHEKLDADNVEEIISDYDVIVDATDGFVTRYLLNDACVLLGKPLVYGAIYQYEGYVSVFGANAPCLRCQFPSPPPAGLIPSCVSAGIMATLPGVIGSFQASEVLKLLIGGGDILRGKMLVVDTWNNEIRKVKVMRNSSCPVCGDNPTITQVENFDYSEFCGLKQQPEEIPVEGIEAEELINRIEQGEAITIIDVREPHERSIIRFPQAVVIPIGQLARRQKELNPEQDTVIICREGKRSILAIQTLREAGYKGPLYNLKGGIEAAKDIIYANEGGWL